MLHHDKGFRETRPRIYDNGSIISNLSSWSLATWLRLVLPSACSMTPRLSKGVMYGSSLD